MKINCKNEYSQCFNLIRERLTSTPVKFLWAPDEGVEFQSDFDKLQLLSIFDFFRNGSRISPLTVSTLILLQLGDLSPLWRKNYHKDNLYDFVVIRVQKRFCP